MVLIVFYKIKLLKNLKEQFQQTIYHPRKLLTIKYIYKLQLYSYIHNVVCKQTQILAFLKLTIIIATPQDNVMIYTYG